MSEKQIIRIILLIIVFIALSNTSMASSQINRVIIINIDALRSDTFFDNVGSTTYFKQLFSHSVYREDATTVFPSITMAAHSSIFVGNYPSEHGVMGFRWFDGDLIDIVEYIIWVM